MTPIEFDSAKDELNITKHGVSLAAAKFLDLDEALITIDDRQNYGEIRYEAIGLIGMREYVVVFTLRTKSVRVISVRKANSRERKRYEQYIQGHI